MFNHNKDKRMQIAIPSKDRTKIFPHFGRTPGFLVVKIEDTKITSKEYVQNTFTGNAQGNHGEKHMQGAVAGQGKGEGHGHNHSHAGIFQALGQCDVVIAGGMGRRLYDEFCARNTKVFITVERNIDTALNLFMNNRLDNNTEVSCSH